MTRPDDAEESSAPSPDPADPLADFDRMEHARQAKRMGAVAWPHVRVSRDGQALVVYTDDATMRAWNDEGWNVVAVAFARDRSELALTKATDGFGLSIRRYPHQRVGVHISIKGLGRASQREPLGACTVRRIGDTFIFKIAEQVVIESR